MRHHQAGHARRLTCRPPAPPWTQSDTSRARPRAPLSVRGRHCGHTATLTIRPARAAAHHLAAAAPTAEPAARPRPASTPQPRRTPPAQTGFPSLQHYCILLRGERSVAILERAAALSPGPGLRQCARCAMPPIKRRLADHPTLSPPGTPPACRLADREPSTWRRCGQRVRSPTPPTALNTEHLASIHCRFW